MESTKDAPSPTNLKEAQMLWRWDDVWLPNCDGKSEAGRKTLRLWSTQSEKKLNPRLRVYYRSGESKLSPQQLYFLRAGQDLRIFKSRSVYDVSAGKLGCRSRGIFWQGAHSEEWDEMWFALRSPVCSTKQNSKCLTGAAAPAGDINYPFWQQP